MAQHRDPRYRGRRRTSAQRRPGHLRTNYTEDDFMAFGSDIERLQSVWPQSVRDSDRKVVKMQYFKSVAILCLIIGVPATVMAVLMAIGGEIPWWMVPVAQSAVVLYMLFVVLFQHNDDDDVNTLIYREADRRGIKYVKGQTPLYYIMNRLNADYNSHLWNRKFNWPQPFE